MEMQTLKREDSEVSGDMYHGIKATIKKLQRTGSDEERNPVGGITVEDVKHATQAQKVRRRTSAATNMSKRFSRKGTVLNESGIEEKSFEFRYSKEVIEVLGRLRAERKMTPGRTPTLLAITEVMKARQATIMSESAIGPQPPEFVRDVVVHNLHLIDRQTVPNGAVFKWEPVDQRQLTLTPIFTPVARRNNRRRRSSINPLKQGSKQRFQSLLQLKREEMEEEAEGKNGLKREDSDDDEMSKALRLHREKEKRERELLEKGRMLPGTARYFDWDSAPNTPEEAIKSTDAWDPILPGIPFPEPPPNAKGRRLQRQTNVISKKVKKKEKNRKQASKETIGNVGTMKAAVKLAANLYNIRRKKLNSSTDEGEEKEIGAPSKTDDDLRQINSNRKQNMISSVGDEQGEDKTNTIGLNCAVNNEQSSVLKNIQTRRKPKVMVVKKPQRAPAINL